MGPAELRLVEDEVEQKLEATEPAKGELSLADQAALLAQAVNQRLGREHQLDLFHLGLACKVDALLAFMIERTYIEDAAEFERQVMMLEIQKLQAILQQLDQQQPAAPHVRQIAQRPPIPRRNHGKNKKRR